MSLLAGFAQGAAGGIQDAWKDNREAAMAKAKESFQMRMLDKRHALNKETADIANERSVEAATALNERGLAKNEQAHGFNKETAGLLSERKAEAARVKNVNSVLNEKPEGQYWKDKDDEPYFVPDGDNPRKGSTQMHTGKGESGERKTTMASLSKDIETLNKSIDDPLRDEVDRKRDIRQRDYYRKQLDSFRNTTMPAPSFEGRRGTDPDGRKFVVKGGEKVYDK